MLQRVLLVLLAMAMDLELHLALPSLLLFMVRVLDMLLA
jgi:hypothetical protein|uniref:Uncharacterized protein n=1 Tax=Picea glauca TaxID=3330 RepID=A0A124GN51_PICGL|nr:hypothetical protein ABT39_MTgene5908 [Picea glauca]QHR92061.1 hypothetical protein Q903MT_gene6097 [Picea sitchensis]